MAKNAENDTDYVLWNLLILTRDAIHKVRERELTRFGITPVQAGTLFAIHNLGDQATISRIGLRIMRKPHSVLNLLQRLEKHGMVKKQKSGNGRTPATYRLTPKGQEAYLCSEKRVSLHRALSALSDAEKQNLTAYLRKTMARTFEDMDDEAKPGWP
jgi:DNA-binding MarR family transcriptional regulator